MDLLEVLGLSPPAADNALCIEIYDQSFLYGVSDEAVQQLCDKCMQLIAPYVDGYIWQHEPLRLRSSIQQLPPWLLKKRGKHAHSNSQQQQQEHVNSSSSSSSSSPSLPFVWGVLRYADHVEDEWWAVWLLLECSRQLHGLAVRVWDDDGDFLLIQAAYALPRWLKPETSTNRVWLRQGQLHIIPQPHSSSSSSKTAHSSSSSSSSSQTAHYHDLPHHPSVTDAIKILSCGNYKTHHERVEAPILARLSGYPTKALQQLQRVIAYLPKRIALLLQHDPQLVAAAVDAFISRQREDVQAAAKFSNFPPTDMVAVVVKLNRCMYAQLMQSDFASPKQYPQPSDLKMNSNWVGNDGKKQSKAFDMGLKITTGFEIMAVRLGLCGGSSSSSQEHVAAAAAAGQQQQYVPPLSANPAWRQYLSSLSSSGYFADEIEGSARYKQLLAAAQAAFTASPAYAASCTAAAAPAQHLQQLLSLIDGQQQQCSSSSSSSDVLRLDVVLEEDSDGWMADEAERAQQQIAAAEAEVAAYEAKKQAKKAAAAAAAGNAAPAAAAAAEVDAEQLVAGFKGFVQAMASHEGAEEPANIAAAAGGAGGGSSSSKRVAAGERQQQQSGVEFNADAFLQELMGIMGSSSSNKHGQQQQQQTTPDADALLHQLQSLQQQLERCFTEEASGKAALDKSQMQSSQSSSHYAGRELGGELDSDDEYGTSSSEGSGFYGSDTDESSDDGNDSELILQQLPVAPPASAKQQQQEQQQQQQWQLPPSFQSTQQQQQQDLDLQQQQQRPILQKLQAAWEVLTATDSDDDYTHSDDDDDALSMGGDEDGTDTDEQGEQHDEAASKQGHGKRSAAGFYDAYSSAMDAELAATTLAQSFETVQGREVEQQQAQPASGSAAGETAATAGLAPIDVDVNLIKSLVKSYVAQGGMPGPASNLAGLLGLKLPTEVVEEQ